MSKRLDDFQDGSQLRRGKPSTHTIFGPGQTVNSASFAILCAVEEAQEFGDAESLKVFIEELKNLYTGQSLDLHWTCNLACPTIDSYFEMVEGSK